MAGDRGLFPAVHAVRRAADDGDAQAVRRPGLERLRHGRGRVSRYTARTIRLCNDTPLGAQWPGARRRRSSTHALRRQTRR